MNNFRKILLIMFLFVFSVCLLTACTDQSSTSDTAKEESEEKIVVDYAQISSIVVAEEETYKSEGFSLETFSVSDIKLTVTYFSEESFQIPATLSMVKAEDKAKLSVAGTHNITLIYGKFNISFLLKLYGKDVKVFTITFLDENNNRVGDIQHVKEGQIAEVPNLESREGKVFVGWTLQGTDTIVDTFTFSSDATLIATYANMNYEVEYYYVVGDDVRYISSATVSRGGNALTFAPTIPVVKGYSNGRWQDEDAMISVSEDGLKFYAIYDKDYVNATFVYFKYTGGEWYNYNVYWKVAEQTEGIPEPDDARRSTEYIFQYWYTLHLDSEGNEVRTKVEFPYVLSAETTFYAAYSVAESGTEGLMMTWLDDGNKEGYYVSGYSGEDTTVIIPKYYDDKSYHGRKEIVGIVPGAFSGENAEKIERFYVSATNNYFRIYNDALYTSDLKVLLAYPRAKAGTKFEIESTTVSMNEIGDYAFYGAKYLQKIVFPDSLQKIGDYSFAACPILSAVDIVPSVVSVGNYAFFGSSGIGQIAFSSVGKLESIGEFAFSGTSVSSITIPGSVKSVGVGFLSDCRKLASISLGAGSMFRVDKDNGCLYGPKDELSTNNPYYYLYAYPAKNSISMTGEININAGTRIVCTGAFYYADILEIAFDSIGNPITFSANSVVCPTIKSMRFNCADLSFDSRIFYEIGSDRAFFPESVYCAREADKLESVLEEDITNAEKAVKDLNSTLTQPININLYYENTGRAEYRLFYSGFAYRLDDGEDGIFATVIAYRGLSEEVFIPQTLGGYTVRKIEKNAFRGNATVRTVDFTESKVKEVAGYAFYQCSSLEKVLFDADLVQIGDYAFADCPVLENVAANGRMLIGEYGKQVFAGTPYVGKEKFVELGGVLVAYNGFDRELSIPGEIAIIADRVFENRDFIGKLIFANDSVLKEIKEYAFYGCSGIEYVCFPTKVRKVGDYAFGECSRLYYVEFDENEEEYDISANACMRTSGEAVKVFLPDSARYKVTLPGGEESEKHILYYEPTISGKTVIGWYKNEGAEQVVDFPFVLEADTVLYAKISEEETAGLIYDYNQTGTFSVVGYDGTDDIVVIPAFVENVPVTGIGKNAFAGKSFIRKIYFENADQIVFVGEDAFDGTAWLEGSSGDTVQIGSVLVRYKGESSVYSIGNDVRYLADGAFSGCSMEKVYVNPYIMTVSDRAFKNCVQLKEVVFVSTEKTENRLIKIGSEAFYGCKSLASFNFDDCKKLSEVSFDAFEKTAWLDGYADDNVILGNVYYRYIGIGANNILHIPNSVTLINPSAFYRNRYLEYVYIPESVERIGKRAFAESSLKKIFYAERNNSLYSIDEEAFYGCDQVIDVDFSLCRNLTEIGERAFSGVKTAENVRLNMTIPERVVEMGKSVFEKSDIYSLYFVEQSRLEVIPENAFAECDKLVSVSFLGANYLQVISQKAFYGCSSLEIFRNSDSSIAEIEAYAFFGCEKMDVFTISETALSYVGENAFSGTPVTGASDTMVYSGTVLLKYNGIATEVYIPDNTTVIATNAFAGNTRISSVVFGEGSRLTEIQQFAFRGCASLGSISLPSTLITCAPGAFADCTKLRSIQVKTTGKEDCGYISVSDSMYKWEVKAGKRTAVLLSYPNKNAGIFEIPGTISVADLPYVVEEIADYAFSGCTNLTDLTIPVSVKKIGSNILNGCVRLSNLVTPFIGRTEDDDTLNFFKYFFGASDYSEQNVLVPQTLKRVTVSKQKSIAAHAFESCFAPTEIVLQEATKIGEKAFYQCIGLLSLTAMKAGGNLFSVGTNALSGCDKLVYINNPEAFKEKPIPRFEGDDVAHLYNYELKYSADGIVSIKYKNPNEEVFVYAMAYVGSEKNVKLAGDINCIFDYAFYGNTSVEKFDASGVSEIGKYAFYACTGLQEIVLPVNGRFSLKNSDSCFEKCTSLLSITLPESLTDIPKNAFAECASLRSVSMKNSVEIISDGAFRGCTSLQSVVLSEKLNEISTDAFNGCIMLSAIDLTNEIKSIGSAAFSGTGLNRVVVPESVTSIGEKAFSGMPYLEEAVIMSRQDALDISKNIFSACPALINVQIPFIKNTFAEYFDGEVTYIFGDDGDIYLKQYVGNIDFNAKSVKIDDEYTIETDEIILAHAETEEERTKKGTFDGENQRVNLNEKDYFYTTNGLLFDSIGNLNLDTSTFDVGGKSYYYDSSLHVYERSGKYEEFTLYVSEKKYAVIPETSDFFEYDGNDALGSIDFELSTITIGSFTYHFENTTIYDSESIYDTIDRKAQRVYIGAQTYCYGENNKLYLLAGKMNKNADFDIDGKKYFLVGGNLYKSESVDCTLDRVNQRIRLGDKIYCYGGNGNFVYICRGKADLSVNVLLIDDNTYYIRNDGIYKETTFVGNIDVKTKSFHVDINNKVCEFAYDDNNNIFELAGFVDFEKKEILLDDILYSYQNYTVYDKENHIACGVYYYRRKTLVIGDNTYMFDEAAAGEDNLRILSGKVNLTEKTFSINNKRYTYENGTIYEDNRAIGTIDIGNQSLTVCIIPVKTLTVFKEKLKSGALAGCSGLSELILMSNVDVQEDALIGCTGLTKLDINLLSETQEKTLAPLFGNDVPSSLMNLTITGTGKLSENALTGCRYIQAVELPNTLTEIGAHAFDGCSSLTRINGCDNIVFRDLTNCDNVQRIGVDAFAGTPWFSNFPDGALYIGKTLYRYVGNGNGTVEVKNGIVYIAEKAFFDCENIQRIVFPSTVSDIGNFAFSGCKTLTEFEFSDGSLYKAVNNAIVKDGVLCFGCAGSTIGLSVTEIAPYAFYGCVNLNGIFIPDSVTKIGEEAFYACSMLTEITVPSTVHTIGKNAFSACDRLETVTIPYVGDSKNETNEKTMSYVFGTSVSNLEKITLSGGKTLAQGAFDGCTNVTTLQIQSDELTTVEEKALNGCTNLESLSLSSNDTYAVKNNCLLLTAEKKVLFGCKTSSIPDDVTEVTAIGDYAFYGCEGITMISYNDGPQPTLSDTCLIIPDGIASIGKGAFALCTSIRSVNIPDNLQSIGFAAFSDCASVVSMNIPFVGERKDGEGRTSFVYILGNPLPNLSSVTIRSGTTFADAAFKDLVGLTQIVLPENLVRIEKAVFYGCSSLLDISIPDSVTSLGEKAFYGCASLETLQIGKGVEELNRDMFVGCRALRTIRVHSENENYMAEGNCLVKKDHGNDILILGCSTSTVPSNVSEIASYAFSDCAGLITMNLSSVPVKSIGEYAFANCTGLKSIYLSGSTTEIKSHAFDGCSTMTTVVFAQGLEKIGQSAFENCISLTSLEFPLSLKEIGENAFKSCVLLLNLTRLSEIEYVGFDAFSGTAWYNMQKNGCVYIGKALYAYKGVMNDGTEITVDVGTVSITGKVFANMRQLASISLPETLVSIGNEAFFGCDSIEKIILPSQIEFVGKDAFVGCAGLKNFATPDLGTDVFKDNSFFDGCLQMEHFVIYSDTEPEMSAYNLLFTDNNIVQSVYLKIAEQFVDGEAIEIPLDATPHIVKDFAGSAEIGERAFISSDPTKVTVEEDGSVTGIALTEQAVTITVRMKVYDMTISLLYRVKVVE